MKLHVGQVCAALCRVRHYDTLAVLLGGLGFDDARIVECFKDELVERGVSMDRAYHALKLTGINLDAEAMLAAIEEVDDRNRREYESIPF